MIVVKVGGSLYDLSDLKHRLEAFLGSLADPDWLLVPGGGATADVIRQFDRDHGLGPERSHWLALRACTLNAHFLRDLLPECVLVSDPRDHRGRGILDPFAFVQRDEGQPGCLPHHWDATSDSVAARVAIVCGACLILLKSITISLDMNWEQASNAGHVDALFPVLVAPAKLSIETVNLRDHPF